MSTLHETTRRRVCRATFLLLCVGSTFGVILWAIWIDSAAHRRTHEAAWSATLDLQVSLGRVSTPRPGVTLYEEVQLVAPETRATLARIQAVEYDRTTSPPTLVASRPELSADQLARAWQALERALRLPPAQGPGFRLAETDLTLHQVDGHDQTLTNLRGHLASAKEAARAAFAFRVAGLEMTSDATLRVERHAVRGTPPITMRIDFQTGDAALPVGLLQSAWPALRHLGEATYRGQLWLTTESLAGEGGASGRLEAVDLQTLIGDQFPTTLSGTAQIDLDAVQISGGRLAMAKGALLASGGRIWHRTLEAAVQHLDCELANPQKRLGVSLPYQELAIGFQLDGTRLELLGKCQHAPGALIVAGDEPLLEQPRSPQNTISLLRLLVPENDLQVPAVSAATELIRRLPLPEAVLDSAGTRAARAHSLRVRTGRK